MSIQVFTDPLNEIFETAEVLSLRDKMPRLGIRKESETAFTVYGFVQGGVPKIRYDIDCTKYEKGVIHSLQAYNTTMTSLPEDRIALDVFSSLPDAAEMKYEIQNLRMMRQPNSVLFYIIPGTDDAIVYTRVSAYYENVEPIIVNTNNFHEIIVSCYPLYEDPRPLNTLRLKTMLSMDPNDSLAYVEAQLDFVTAILLAIVEANSELKLDVLKKVNEYANFKDAVEQNMIFGIKSVAKCLEEIRVNKAKAREVQQVYYRERAKMEGANV